MIIFIQSTPLTMFIATPPCLVQKALREFFPLILQEQINPSEAHKLNLRNEMWTLLSGI